MNRDKNKKVEVMAELESQFILRLPEEPSKALRELLKTGDNIKNRLTIQIENDMRHGEVRFDHWLMHAKIFDLPTITESLKTIDNKSFYKTADICQMMICKEEADQTPSEEESPTKNKKKDPYKVDKKFLWPHGITPPTKNVRKRRFRKTLKKKYVEAPEIEKEVKRLLRTDNEAVSVTWEVIKEDDEQLLKQETVTPAPTQKPEKKTKAMKKAEKQAAAAAAAAAATAAASAAAAAAAAAVAVKTTPVTSTITSAVSSTTTSATPNEAATTTADISNTESSNVVDIFGGALSDSDIEDGNINVELEDSHLTAFDSRLSDNCSMPGLGDIHKRDNYPIEFESQMFQSSHSGHGKKKSNKSRTSTPATSTITRSGGLSSEEDGDYHSRDMSKDNMTFRIEQLRTELEELKQRRQRTQHEIAGMENLALRQRFQDILHTLNQDVMYKEMEYQGLITLQNSEDI
ncbi:transcription initiation factor TFIID subunit 7-like [Vanessa tameamea]|uniref:Transcription initiation factor TFIID subunit 7-like n=1 Tax=Vanessa tameamea TaxID=334116 RepID=A0A8B8IUG2_VANTA|nr:transcription initiation factor TFIID subunit 7-like [Vanessa tameamea]